MLARCVQAKTTEVSLEVSSHGIVLDRIKEVQFEGAIFTNLTQDHLDFHGSMEAYFQAKLAFLKDPKLKFVVVNQEDTYSQRIIEALSNQVTLWTFSYKHPPLKKAKSIFAQNIECTETGLCFDVFYGTEKAAVCCPFYGEFNVENILAVMTALLAKGIPFQEVATRACALTSIAGRMEKLGKKNGPQVFVDYAHTPDALLKALNALKQHQYKKLSVVFGCGGDRDTGKRAQMGRISCEHADTIILTDDNPRYETSASIIEHILTGCQSEKVRVINNRKQAIDTAIAEASLDTCLLIAGKGHEDYQDIKGTKYPFSDQAIAQQALEKWGK
jgi:UDP-N-acetylmuramoyl-L-alanyl-D-glutamate--2,6-diaminopimelate ligase